jgi:hypothetical protein
MAQTSIFHENELSLLKMSPIQQSQPTSLKELKDRIRNAVHSVIPERLMQDKNWNTVCRYGMQNEMHTLNLSHHKKTKQNLQRWDNNVVCFTAILTAVND